MRFFVAGAAPLAILPDNNAMHLVLKYLQLVNMVETVKKLMIFVKIWEI